MLGLNHTTAPLEVRERVGFNAAQRAEALAAFRQQFPASEVVLLSTCNRVELYSAREVHGHPRAGEMARFIAGFHGIPHEQLAEHLYKKVNRDVVDHLFHVASSLDSMVLGETQILGQVREAYDAAAQASAAGAMLNPLFQRAIAAGREVMNETALAEGRLSVASIAVDYARGIFDHFDDKTVLCVGAGKMARLMLQSFVGLQPGRLLICNRDAQKATELAARFGGQAAPFDGLADHVIAADIVLTSTGSPQPILTRTQFEGLRKRRRYRPIFLIDIAVPRDVEAAVGEIDDVYLYNLDDLQQVVSRTQSQRKVAIAAARAVVARHVDSFLSWHRQRELGPSIQRLYERYHAVAQEELARTLNKLSNVSEADRDHLQELARRIVNKLLNDPVQMLRSDDGAHPPGIQYLHTLEKMFRLNSEDENP